MVRIGLGILRPDLDPTTLYLTVEDAKGTYTIPYIQSDRTLRVEVDFLDPRVEQARVAVSPAGFPLRIARATRERPVIEFEGLACGEYNARIVYTCAGEAEPVRERYERIGIGTVIGAIGDSITEGYYGYGFQRGEDLAAADFPAEAVSRDGRNFPQFSPTTAWHLPEVNCFQSWMTHLNDRLTDAWRRPVFIANEGWGGYTTEAYLALMRTDANWQARMRRLRPTVWLIHLGVNDERAQAPPEVFAANLTAIVDVLTSEYGAAAERILVAKPCYDYAEGAESILRSYCGEIDRLVAERGLSAGPDFFRAYSTDRARWYGADPVHPNTEGMARMAELWSEALVRAIPQG